MIQSILAAVDGSEASTRAAGFARDLAVQTGAHLTLLVVIRPPTAVSIPPFDALALSGPSPDADHLAAVQQLVARVEADLPGSCSSDVQICADPAATICSEALRLGVDLIVVGARDRTTAERLFLGSVSEAVVRDAGRPVTVVH